MACRGFQKVISWEFQSHLARSSRHGSGGHRSSRGRADEDRNGRAKAEDRNSRGERAKAEEPGRDDPGQKQGTGLGMPWAHLSSLHKTLPENAALLLLCGFHTEMQDLKPMLMQHREPITFQSKALLLKEESCFGFGVCSLVHRSDAVSKVKERN